MPTIRRGEMLRDEPAKGNPGNARTGDAPPPHNIGELLGQVGNAIAIVGHRGFARDRAGRNAAR
ncbi:MAG TPA: hypothetical protein VKE72_09225 [Methylocella sp.]|nr:hypothetical protein [Methylocella sp.]